MRTSLLKLPGKSHSWGSQVLIILPGKTVRFALSCENLAYASPLSGCDQLNSRGRLAVARPVSCCGYDKAVGSWNRVPRPHRVSVLWRCPTLPHPPRCSTIGACGLSFQVRNGCWAFPRGYDHHKMVQPYSLEYPHCCRRFGWREGFVLVVIRIVV